MVETPPSEVGCVITTLNEADTIGELIGRLRGWGFSVFVVDGGSTDGTLARACVAGAAVKRMGSTGRVPIGPCLREGWRMALDAGCTRIVQMDAGGSHRGEDLAPLLAVPADVVIGSRFLWAAQYQGRPWRALLSRVATLACNLAQNGPWLHDWTSGYRVYSAAAVRELLAQQFVADMHGVQMEALAYARRAGFSVIEVPITYRAGRSSFGWSVANEAILTWLHILHNVGGAR
jgi:dolichol-phosphate mannosyltransferase